MHVITPVIVLFEQHWILHALHAGHAAEQFYALVMFRKWATITSWWCWGFVDHAEITTKALSTWWWVMSDELRLKTDEKTTNLGAEFQGCCTGRINTLTPPPTPTPTPTATPHTLHPHTHTHPTPQTHTHTPTPTPTHPPTESIGVNLPPSRWK